MKYNYLWAILFLTFYSCFTNTKDKPQEYNPRAVALNNKAMQVARDNYRDNASFELLDEAIKIDPEYYKSYTNKANIYVWRKEFEMALAESDKSLKLNSDIAERWFTTGMLYEKTGNREKAEKYYKKSIALFTEKLADAKNQGEINAIVFNRALSKICLGDSSYKFDFNDLEKHQNYATILDDFRDKTSEELINLLL